MAVLWSKHSTVFLAHQNRSEFTRLCLIWSLLLALSLCASTVTLLFLHWSSSPPFPLNMPRSFSLWGLPAVHGYIANSFWVFITVSQALFFFFFLFKLYNIVLVLPNIEMNPPQIYLCSPSWTLLPPPSPYPPSGSSKCTSPKHPVSCIKPGLVTRFIHDIIHVSMSFSQISPPSPSPTESIRLFYTSVSLLLSRIQGYCYPLSKFHIYA